MNKVATMCQGSVAGVGDMCSDRYLLAVPQPLDLRQSVNPNLQDVELGQGRAHNPR